MISRSRVHLAFFISQHFGSCLLECSWISLRPSYTKPGNLSLPLYCMTLYVIENMLAVRSLSFQVRYSRESNKVNRHIIGRKSNFSCKKIVYEPCCFKFRNLKS